MELGSCHVVLPMYLNLLQGICTWRSIVPGAAHKSLELRLSIKIRNHVHSIFETRGPIFSAASLEVMTGCTSKSAMSIQLAIHLSTSARFSVSMSW